MRGSHERDAPLCDGPRSDNLLGPSNLVNYQHLYMFYEIGLLTNLLA